MAESVNIEILSADPIGPLTLAQGRTAVQGDILTRLLAFTGSDPRREYYVNDMGQRAVSLCQSVRHCLLLDSEGDAVIDRFDRTVRDVASQLSREIGSGLRELPEDEWRRLCESRVPDILLGFQKETLSRLGVEFDTWFRETDLSSRQVDSAVRKLAEANRTETSGDAVWLRTDDDRVLLRREDGAFTYLAVDIAYHLSKIDRGADRMIDVWGSAYHRHRERVREALRYLDIESPLEILVSGPITFENDRMPVSYVVAPSILLDPLLDAGGVVNLRWLLNGAAPEETLVLEVNALNDTGRPDPVARAQQALKNLTGAAPEGARKSTPSDLAELRAVVGKMPDTGPSLVAEARAAPDRIETAARTRRPDRISVHLTRLTDAYQAAEEDGDLGSLSSSARHGTGAAIQTILGLLMGDTDESDPSPGGSTG